MLSTDDPGGESVGEVLRLIRSGGATTRAELAAATGLARSTVAQRVEALMSSGLVVENGGARSTGGRPPSILQFNADAGVVLVADLGATHSRLALSDLSATPLAESAIDMAISEGPEAVLEKVDEIFRALLADCDRTAAEVRGVGIGVPGPVDHTEGRAVNPPIMPGWNGHPIRERFEAEYGVPVLVDNDVNIMALGEYWVMSPKVDDFLFVKVGTGIGSGLILGGRLHRGAQGAAGDIGHVQAGGAEVLCRCGNAGCLEASAGGGALAGALTERGTPAADARDVVELVMKGEQSAIQIVREAGRLIGRVLATTVNLLNPALIMIGGDLASAEDQLLAGVREIVYRRSTTLSTTALQIIPSSLGDRAGITGAAAMVLEQVLAPVSVNAALAAPGT